MNDILLSQDEALKTAFVYLNQEVRKAIEKLESGNSPDALITLYNAAIPPFSKWSDLPQLCADRKWEPWMGEAKRREHGLTT